MKVDNLALQHVVRFTGNKSDFTKQPIFLMSNNIGLTGDDFIALYRITRGQGNNNTYRESDDIPKNKKSGSEVPSNELSTIRGAKTNIDEVIIDVFVSKNFFDR